MSNLYCDLESFKARMGITGTGDDAQVLALLENISRAIDQFCNRFFFVKDETRYYDGVAGPLLLDGDLVAVTSVKTDDDADGAGWETTWSASDYELLPYNGFPKNAIAVTPWGGRSDFNKGGKKAVEVAGRWGYREEIEDSSADINEGAQYSAADNTLTVTDGTEFKTGMTVRIESEQLYVSAISGNDLMVERAVNGTTAAAHADGTGIDVYRYPRPMAEACLIQAARIWKRKDSAYIVNVAAATFRQEPFPDVDPDVRTLLAPYRRIVIAGV